MNILITGASGFIGSHLLSTLRRHGHTVTACARRPRALQQQWPGIKVIAADFSRDTDISHWLPRLNNIDVVINTVGIIAETRRHSFEALHTQAPMALFQACAQAGVQRVIQISALGADDTAFSRYHLSKRAADRCLMALDLDWTILQPSLVHGPGAKSGLLFKAMASLPLIPLIGKGQQPVQPIHINDLCQAITRIIDTGAGTRAIIAAVGPTPVTMKALYQHLRHWLGLGPAHFLPMPYTLALQGATVAGAFASTPMNREAIQMLEQGNTADAQPFIDTFGFQPMSFEQALAATPAQEPDRWHARLFLLKPLLRLTLALLWIFTGLVSAFGYPPEQSYPLLASAGIPGQAQPLALYGAATLDFALGLALLIGYRIPLIGLLQIAVIIGYTAILSVTQPEFWLHPFGPLSKNLPLIIATLIMIALERKP